MSNNQQAPGGGFFFSVLTIAFIVLKLTGVIDWSWWWVLCPLLIPWIVVCSIIALAMGIALILDKNDLKKNDRK